MQGDYVGIGPGASSHRRGVRSTNLKTVESWAKAVLAGAPATASAETLRPMQRAAEALWLGIRRRAGVDLERLEQRLAVPARAHFAAILDRQQADGLIHRDGTRVALTPAGLLLADRVGGDYLAAGLSG